MNSLRVLRLAAAVLALVVPGIVCAQTASPLDRERALLHCDVGVTVKSVDGDTARTASNPDGMTDCMIRVEPGRHVAVLEFSWDSSLATSHYGIRAKSPATVDFDALAARLYRARFQVFPAEKAWIEDVTDEERDLPSHEPFSAKSRDVPKNQRTSIVIARISPDDMSVMLAAARTRGILFERSGHSTTLKAKKGAKFVLETLDAGETAGLVFASSRGKGLSNPTQIFPCDAARVPVFENVSGGQVVYLGHFGFERVATGYGLRFSQEDLEEVRADLAKDSPELASQLQAAPYRMARLANPCREMHMDWIFHQLVETLN
jgi:hypothetical protein